MIIQIDQLKKSYGAVRAVDDVSLDVQGQEILAIAGESGSGKSTLAKIMAGLVRPDAGSIKTEGGIQMVFQDPQASLDPLYTIQRILMEAFTRQKHVSPRQRQQDIQAMLVKVGLEDGMLQRFPHEFSGGQRQRIAIARALLTRPAVLILDEPTSALDVLVQKQILHLLTGLKQEFNLTYIFISHNLRVIRHFSDRIAVMHNGRIVEIQKAADLFARPQHPYTRRLLSAALDYSDG